MRGQTKPTSFDYFFFMMEGEGSPSAVIVPDPSLYSSPRGHQVGFDGRSLMGTTQDLPSVHATFFSKVKKKATFSWSSQGYLRIMVSINYFLSDSSSIKPFTRKDMTLWFCWIEFLTLRGNESRIHMGLTTTILAIVKWRIVFAYFRLSLQFGTKKDVRLFRLFFQRSSPSVPFPCCFSISDTSIVVAGCYSTWVQESDNVLSVSNHERVC